MAIYQVSLKFITKTVEKETLKIIVIPTGGFSRYCCSCDADMLVFIKIFTMPVASSWAWKDILKRYLTIIPQVHIGYKLAIIISYPMSASGIIVLSKTPTNYREFFPNLFVKTTGFQFVFIFEQTYIYHISRAWYNGSYTMMAKPIRALELHHPMIQFLLI